MPSVSVRSECAAAAAGYRLVLPRGRLAGRAGDLLGRGTGASLEFVDYRDYSPGDDLRRVDWRSYARTDQLAVRLYREEVSPSLDLIVDTSASMAVTEAKAVATLDLACAVGLWTKSRGGTPRVYAAGADVLPEPDSIEFGGRHCGWIPRATLRQSSLRFVVSDFLDREDAAPALRRIAAGASHVYVVQLLDAWELAPEVAGPRTLVDVEAGARLDVTLDARTVAGYVERLARLRAGVERAVRSIGGSYACIAADSPARMFRDGLMGQGIVEPAA